MIKSKSIWETYIDNFLSNDVTITDITNFLKNIYNIKLEKYEINVQPRTHWKTKLEKEIKDKKILYILTVMRSRIMEVSHLFVELLKLENMVQWILILIKMPTKIHKIIQLQGEPF